MDGSAWTACEDRMADEDLGLLPRLGISLYTMRPNQHCTERAAVTGIIFARWTERRFNFGKYVRVTIPYSADEELRV